MTSFPVHEAEPRLIAVVEVDPHAEMHSPKHPYRVVLFEPEDNVLDTETPHGVRNLSRAELMALGHAIANLLEATEERA